MRKSNLSGGLVLAAVLTAAAASVFAWSRASTAPKQGSRRIETTPERVARGEYLFKHAANCDFCHTEHDYQQDRWPLREETRGGGMCLHEHMDFGGATMCGPNITPDLATGVGSWSDDELIRAIREGVRPDGKMMFPVMPYPYYREMSDEDAEAVVAYLRTLEPISRSFPPNALGGFEAPPAEPLTGPVAAPPRENPVEYGRYLTQLGWCKQCHDHHEKGTFAGGYAYPGPSGAEVAANLTLDPETGLGAHTRESFIGLFKAYERFDPTALGDAPVRAVMPWLAYARMTEADLGAIFAYFQSLPKVPNPITKFPPPQCVVEGEVLADCPPAPGD